MKVRLEISSWFKRYTGGELAMEVELSPGAAVLHAVRMAGIPEEEVGFAVVNDVKVEMNHPLKDGDALKVYPVIIGG